MHIFFYFLFDKGMLCVFINIKKEITLNYPKSAAMEFFQETQERGRNSRGKRATKCLLYFGMECFLNQC